MNAKRIALAAAILLMCCVPALAAEYTVGAYYYPWYGDGNFHGGPKGTLRYHLVPREQPVLGWYNDRDAAVVGQHFRWARAAGIDYFVTSYWGQGGSIDWTIRNCLFTNPDIGNLKLAVFLEPSITTANIASETSYLCTYYFNRPSYYRIDGKPVIYVYLTRTKPDADLAAFIDNIRTTARNAGVGEVYIVGDEVFGGSWSSSTYRCSLMNAITCYDTYGHLGSLGAGAYASTSNLNSYKTYNDNWKALAHSGGADFIPNVSPGFNDTAVRGGHSPMSRKLGSEAGAPGSLFSGLLDKAKLTLDRSTIMITSWNEWHEDTQIEPVAPAAETNVVDGLNGSATNGIYYDGYDTLYLDILRAKTSDLPVPPPIPAKPTNPGASLVTTTSIRWIWTDTSDWESGFKVWADPTAIPPTTLRATTAANATGWDYTGLVPNTRCYFQVAATNTMGDSAKTSAVNATTLADQPTPGVNAACDKAPGVYPPAASFVFSNPIGFGSGGHYKVSRYAYAWDTSPTHDWSGTQTIWLSGTLTKTTSAGGDYYLHLRSLNSAGIGNVATLDYGPFTVLASNGRIAEARAGVAGSAVSLGSKVLYYHLGDFGYIEEPDRSCGIRVVGPDLPAEGGVCLKGTLVKPAGSECYVLVDTITRIDASSVTPVGMINASLARPLADGLYVKTWGVVRAGSVTENSFVISDGSTADSVVVVTNSVPTVTAGQFVTVTGAVGLDGAPRIHAKAIAQ